MNPAASAPRAVSAPKRLLEILNKITSGKGTLEDIDKLEELCYYIKENSLCGLGQTAPNPVLSTLKYYRDEYIAHVTEHRCPAGACKALTNYVIDADKCQGLHALRTQLPGRRHLRHRPRAACHRYAEVHQVRCLP